MNLFTPIFVSGSDARAYLQGQLTCDIDKLTRDNSLLACCNSAQGRVQAVMTVMERDAGIVLTVVSEIAELTIQRLRKYVLRSKVRIELLDSSLATAYSLQPSASLLSQLRAGVPHVFPETHEAFVAQMLNLDVLGGISFEKGCYTGQEIIARAHFRGAVKRRMFRFAANCLPPAPGARLLAEGAHAGEVVYAARVEQNCELLAVINLAQADSVIQLEEYPTASVQRLPLPYSL